MPRFLSPFDYGGGLGVAVTITPYAFVNAAATTAIEAQLSQIAASGFDWVRVTINHADHDPTPGSPLPTTWSAVHNSAKIDTLFAKIEAAGLRAVVLCSGLKWETDPQISFSPSYAFTMPRIGGPAWERFAQFFAQVAAKHDGGGRHIWECCNEPNLGQFAVPFPDAATYLHGLLRFGEKVKAATATPANPRGAFVLGMTTSRVPLDWFEALVAHPAAEVVDAVGPHPYTDNDEGASGWGGGPANGPVFGPFSQSPDPRRGDPATAIPQFEAVREILRRGGCPEIEVLSTEWGQSEAYTEPVPTDAMTPAFTTTHTANGSQQLLQNADDFDPLWIKSASAAITYDGTKPGRSFSAVRYLHPVLGYYSEFIHSIPHSAAATLWPTNTWYGYRFWARASTPTRIWAGTWESKQGFELGPDWKEFRGAYNPGGHHWYHDEDPDGPEGPGEGNSRVFNIATHYAGGGFDVAGVQAWKMTSGDVASAKRTEHARLCGEIARAVRAAGCPLHIHYRWEDLTGTTIVEGQYGLVRTDGTPKPALASLVATWDGDEEFDPRSLAGSLVAWYDVGFGPSRFVSATGTSAADLADVGDPLGRLEDLSGHGRHLVRYSSDAARPTLAAYGGRVKAVFDGSNDMMHVASDAFALAQPFFIGVWSVATGGGDYHAVMGFWDSSPVQRFLHRNRSNGTQLDVQLYRQTEGFREFSFAAARGVDPVVTAISNVDANTFSTMGESRPSLPIQYASATNVRLAVGAAYDGTIATPLHLGELLILDGAPDAATLGRITSYLKRKWNL